MDRLPPQEPDRLSPREWQEVGMLMKADPASMSSRQTVADNEEYLELVSWLTDRHRTD